MTFTQLKDQAKSAGKELTYNKSVGGYQIRNGFTVSEIEYAGRDENGKLYLDANQIAKLASYI